MRRLVSPEMGDLLEMPAPESPYIHLSGAALTGGRFRPEINGMSGADVSLWRSADLHPREAVPDVDTVRGDFTRHFSDRTSRNITYINHNGLR